MSFTVFIFLSSIINMVNMSLDNYLLGSMMGTVAVAVYGIGAQFNGYYNMISSSVATVFAPTINKIVAESDNNEALTDIFIDVSKPLFWALSIVLLGFFFFGRWFISIWAGEGYALSYYVALILMGGCLVPLVQVCGIEIQKAKNMHRARAVVMSALSFLNVIVSVALIPWAGVIGASIGTFVSMTLGDTIYMNWYYYRRIGLDMPRYWKIVLAQTKYLVIPTLVGAVYLVLPNQGNLITMCSGLAFVSSFLLVLCKNERQTLAAIVRRG